MVMSLLGHYNNFFFAAHLLDIAMGVKTLRTILSSVTHNGKQVWRGPGRGAVVIRQQASGMNWGGARALSQSAVGSEDRARALWLNGVRPRQGAGLGLAHL